jgi:hypothetical protein
MDVVTKRFPAVGTRRTSAAFVGTLTIAVVLLVGYYHVRPAQSSSPAVAGIWKAEKVAQWGTHQVTYVLKSDGTGRKIFSSRTIPLNWSEHDGAIILTLHWGRLSSTEMGTVSSDRQTITMTKTASQGLRTWKSWRSWVSAWETRKVNWTLQKQAGPST